MISAAQDLLSGDACHSIPAFLTDDDWRYVIQSLQLSPQQAKIVKLILHRKQDKEIAVELGLNRYTIRTYLRRVFDRIGLEDRMDLALHIFALCLRRRDERGRPLRGDTRKGSLAPKLSHVILPLRRRRLMH